MVTCTHAGKPGFKYNGPVSDSTFKKSFDLVCMTSDSRNQTLIADFDSHRVHTVNYDRKFFYNIDKCDIRHQYDFFCGF